MNLALSAADRRALGPVLLDPVAFAGGILRDRPWALQREIMRSVATRPLTAVKACHASGKTHCAARIALWWLMRWAGTDSKVITTAPTWRQVKLMWAEIAEAAGKSRLPFPEPSATGINFSEQHYAIGLSTNDPTKFQGYHGAHVLIIVDEATGVMASIFDAIEGVRAGGDVRVLLLGNPTVPGGKFYDAFYRDRSIWNNFTISAFDTPNFAGVTQEQLATMGDDELGAAKSPYLITRRWVRERLERWGAAHPMYRARVLGQFPEQSELSVYSLAWIERAAREPDEPPAGGIIQVGIDVAGPGEDETVMVARCGGVILECQAWSLPDPRGALAHAISQLRGRRGFQLGAVVVDAVGIGYHVATHLADLGFQVFAFNAGSSPVDREQFENAKAEAYWSLREWMDRDAIRGLTDEEAQAQLAGIRYKHTAAGRVQIEKKEDARKRGQTSPDRAEAHVLAFLHVTPREQTVVYDDWEAGHISPI